MQFAVQRPQPDDFPAGAFCFLGAAEGGLHGGLHGSFEELVVAADEGDEGEQGEDGDARGGEEVDECCGGGLLYGVAGALGWRWGLSY